MTLVVLAVGLGALAQSVSGIGFTLVSGPLLVATLGPTDGVRLSVLLSLVVNVVVLTRTRRQASIPDALLLLVPAVLATPLLVRLVRGVPARTAELLAGSAVVLGATVLAAGVRWRAAGGRAGAVLAGVLSAAMNVVAGVGGPAVALYAANADWPAAAMRSTGQVYFLGLNLVAAVALGLPTVAGLLVVGCLVALAAGLLAGARLAPLVPEALARRVTLSLAALGGLVVLVRAI
ncbi:MAG: TSUP family transporter [Frankiales bacterium]|nr:TSUP family transporter [Frankiales bacterium]